jgi:V8-like Glu-specific endopeptidase
MFREEPLGFVGDRHQPLDPQALAELKPILTYMQPPQELLTVGRRQTILVSGQSTERPDVSVTRLEGEGWRIDLTLKGEQQFTVPRVKAFRNGPEFFRKSIAVDVSHQGYRPDWIDHFYQPRTVPRRRHKPMRRFDGNAIRPLWTFGDFDPRLYRDSSYPWGCIGLIENNEGMTGTGTLVGRNIVVTAGHLVPWSSGDHGWMRFTPANYLDTGSLFGKTVESYALEVRGYDNDDSVTGYDWAILKLDQPLGDLAGWMGYNSYSDNWEDLNVWTIVGYPGGWGPVWQGGISINDDDDDSNDGQELETEDADTEQGHSGGPLFAWWGNDPRVVGVVSGEETEYKPIFAQRKDNVLASGPGFTNLIAWGRSNW